jgi:hypothetical protein
MCDISEQDSFEKKKDKNSFKLVELCTGTIIKYYKQLHFTKTN